MNRSLSKKRISVEGLCAYSVKFNHAVVTVGWRSGKETTTNLVIQLRFHNLLRKQKLVEGKDLYCVLTNFLNCNRINTQINPASPFPPRLIHGTLPQATRGNNEHLDIHRA